MFVCEINTYPVTKILLAFVHIINNIGSNTCINVHGYPAYIHHLSTFVITLALLSMKTSNVVFENNYKLEQMLLTHIM